MRRFREALFLFGAVVVSAILVLPSVCAIPSPELGLKNIEKDLVSIEDLPDLTISIDMVNSLIFPSILEGKLLMDFDIFLTIKNEGNAAVHIEPLMISIIFERNGIVKLEVPYDLSKKLDVEYLEPDQEIHTYFFTYSDFNYEKKLPLLADIRVIVDSENLIEELDEDNNDDLYTWPYFIGNIKHRLEILIEWLFGPQR